MKSLLSKAAGRRPATLLKKTLTQMLSCKYYEISKSTYFQEHLYTAASKVSLGSDCFTTFLLNSRYQTV